MMERTSGIRSAARRFSFQARAELAAHFVAFKKMFELADASQAQILPEDFAHGVCLGRIDHELTVHAVVAQGDEAPHPHALFLRSRDFVSDSFTGDFTFELS